MDCWLAIFMWCSGVTFFSIVSFSGAGVVPGCSLGRDRAMLCELKVRGVAVGWDQEHKVKGVAVD